MIARPFSTSGLGPRGGPQSPSFSGTWRQLSLKVSRRSRTLDITRQTMLCHSSLSSPRLQWYKVAFETKQVMSFVNKSFGFTVAGSGCSPLNFLSLIWEGGPNKGSDNQKLQQFVKLEAAWLLYLSESAGKFPMLFAKYPEIHIQKKSCPVCCLYVHVLVKFRQQRLLGEVKESKNLMLFPV